MVPIQKLVFGQKYVLAIYGLMLGFRGLMTMANPQYFLASNICFIHEKPLSFHFRPSPIQIHVKEPVFQYND